MTCDEQLRRWVDGDPVHNDERDECTPDFSCCDRTLLAPREAREAFRDAGEEERLAMLGGFLGRMVKAEGMQLLDEAEDTR